MIKMRHLFLVLLSFNVIAKAPETFPEAMEEAKKIWSEHPQTIYCGCSFLPDLSVDAQSCHYQPKDPVKGNQVKWRHVVPVISFAKERPCWQKPLCEGDFGKKYKGLTCCKRIDSEFLSMYTDLHNLVPEIWEVHEARGDYLFGGLKRDYQFGEFYSEHRKHKFDYNGCPLFIRKDFRVVEPRDEIKGLIARTYLYMNATYPIHLTNKQKRIFHHWNDKFPPSDWEKTWNQKVKAVQGNENLYISKYQQKS